MSKTVYENADVLLGNKDDRYFGNGYKNVIHDIYNVSITDTNVSAFTTIKYPKSWSRKNTSTDLVPHLSTIDATYIGLQLCEIFLITALVLDDNERNNVFIKKLKLKSGSLPLENLKEISTILSYKRNEKEDDEYDTHIFDGVVGNIHFYAELETEKFPFIKIGRIQYSDSYIVLGDLSERYYGNLFQRTIQNIENIKLDVIGVTASADISITNDFFERESCYGIDNNFLSDFSPSVIDCIVAIAQLSQVLIYDIDALDRKKSNTLWMRKINIDRRRESFESFHRSHISANKSIVLKMKDDNWRIFDMQGSFYNFTFNYSIAHKLPETETNK
ncbi:AvrD family protein [Enterococcus casseliflavus]